MHVAVRRVVPCLKTHQGGNKLRWVQARASLETGRRTEVNKEQFIELSTEEAHTKGEQHALKKKAPA
jgi:hypothetical protein